MKKLMQEKCDSHVSRQHFSKEVKASNEFRAYSGYLQKQSLFKVAPDEWRVGLD